MARFYAKQPLHVDELNAMADTDMPSAARLTTGIISISRITTETPVGTVYLTGDRSWAEIDPPAPPVDFEPFFLI